ncbi:hypothetical protein [Candidatus Regiella insecticola]|uniref:hypothetical protein n=1 Tax=Candidatus Regiella insecticola TaxID=138073 RepID=UPI0015968118|nr:hypothetical protein [Candidatus Regiella insecticola]
MIISLAFWALSSAYTCQVTQAGTMGRGAMGINTGWQGYLPSHASGGYTGEGDKYHPAGIVHKGEFVMTKAATERIGVDNLYALMHVYAQGGLVNHHRTTSAKAPLLGMQGKGTRLEINVGDINILNQGAGQPQSTVSAQESAALRKQIKMAITTTLSEQLSKPGTPLWLAVQGRG